MNVFSSYSAKTKRDGRTDGRGALKYLQSPARREIQIAKKYSIEYIPGCGLTSGTFLPNSYQNVLISFVSK